MKKLFVALTLLALPTFAGAQVTQTQPPDGIEFQRVSNLPYDGTGRAIKQQITATNSFLRSFSFWNYNSGTLPMNQNGLYYGYAATFALYRGDGARWGSGYLPGNAIFSKQLDPFENGKITIDFGDAAPLEVGETYSAVVYTLECIFRDCAGPSTGFTFPFGVDITNGNWYDGGKAFANLYDPATVPFEAVLVQHYEFPGDLRFEMVQGDAPSVVVPEPSTLLLTASALVAVAAGRRRAKKRLSARG